MKKLFLLVGIALLAFSCSSDNNEEEGYTPPKVRTEYEVNYYISREEINKHPIVGYNSRAFILPKTTEQSSSNMGIIIYDAPTSSLARNVKAYDLCCPLHWEDDDPQKHILTLDTSSDMDVYAKCEKSYETFSLSTGRSTSEIAGEFVDLIKYNVDSDPSGSLVSEENIIGYYITNPKYKK